MEEFKTKKKSVLVLGVVGILTLSMIGFKNVSAKEPINVSNRDEVTVITAEEQNKVENSTKLSGFIQQENSSGFFFRKWSNLILVLPMMIIAAFLETYLADLLLSLFA